jgi:hypothetical protein
VTRGSGAHWAAMPAARGPIPKPSDSATAARRAPASSTDPGSNGAADSSFIHAVPAAKMAPLATPATKRPPNSSGSERLPAMRRTVATMETTTAGRTRRARPQMSAAGPPSSRAMINPTA